MTFAYYASFDIEDVRNGLGTITFSRSGSSSFVLDLQNGVAGGNGAVTHGCSVLNHYTAGLGSFVSQDTIASTQLNESVAFDAFDDRISNRMQVAGTTAGWPSAGGLTCTFSMSTLRYTFTGATFTAIAFSNAATRALFGFTSDFSGSSASVAGTAVPDYVIQPTLSCVSTFGDEGFNYEVSGISATVLNDYGAQFGMTRSAPPLFRDWTQQSEVKAKTLRIAAGSTHPMTHEKLFMNCRTFHPFVISDGFNESKDYCFKLRPDACQWSSRAVKRNGGDADDALFDVSYRAQLLGAF